MTVQLTSSGPGKTHARVVGKPFNETDSDFVEGYRAGYEARSDHRAVLGTPAYRQGHAYGVQQSASERAVLADAERRLTPRMRFWRALVVGVMLGLLLGVYLTPAKADTLSDWNLLNEVCQGGSGAVADRACTQRQTLTTRLRASGWYEGTHAVWVSPAHAAAFNRLMRRYDEMARANIGQVDRVMQGMMADLRREVPDEALFALWNGSAGELLAHTPYAAAMLMHGLAHLERMLSGRRDPRFVMVLRP